MDLLRTYYKIIHGLKCHSVINNLYAWNFQPSWINYEKSENDANQKLADILSG